MNILISFAGEKFVNSKWLLRLCAKRLGIFDKIIIYGPKDLPAALKCSPAQMFECGCGYYTWKPYVVYRTLEQAKAGDVVYYIDAGCILQRSPQWEHYQQLMLTHNGIFFNYRHDYDYHWEKWGHNSVAIKHWCKPATAGYFGQYFANDTNYLEMQSLWAGFFIVKKTQASLGFLDDWLHLALFRQDLWVDPIGAERLSLPTTLCKHRYDQAMLTFLVNYYKDKDKLVVLPETSESQPETAAVVAARYRVGKLSLLDTIKFRAYHLFKSK